MCVYMIGLAVLELCLIDRVMCVFSSFIFGYPGDVVGTGFDIPHLDAPNIFNKMVHGDGQHYLFDIGINMYWLKFLHEVNQLTNEILMDALFGMNKGKRYEYNRFYYMIIFYDITERSHICL